MIQFDEQKYDDIKLEAQYQQQLMDEPMYNVDKYQIMVETQNFNDLKIQSENTRIILVKLIYLVNQGINFSDQEVEQLFFRITKLFQLNNSRLRKMIYKTIKIVMKQNYIHILIQSLCKDLMSVNPQIKIQALKFIPFILGEQYIHQIERFVKNALQDTNLQVSSTALIVGIHIVNRFPNLVGQWFFGLVQNIDQQQENIEYHALILLHEIYKTNLSQFIKIMFQLINRPLKPLIQQQLIKFIQDLFKILDDQQKKIIINYLLQLRNSKDPLVFFQAALISIKIQEIQNFQLKPLINQLNTILSLNDIQLYLQKFISLNLIEKLIKIPSRQNLIQGETLIYVKGYAFSFFVSIASRSLQICINLYGQNAAYDLRTIFYSTAFHNCQQSFLKAFLELIISDPTYGSIALKFISLIVIEFHDNSFVNIVINLLEQIMMISKNNIQSALDILSKISEIQLNLTQQLQVIRLIGKFYLEIKIEFLGSTQISLIYKFLKNQFFNKAKDCTQIALEQYQFIRKEIIHIQQQNFQNKIEQIQIKNYFFH